MQRVHCTKSVFVLLTAGLLNRYGKKMPLRSSLYLPREDLAPFGGEGACSRQPSPPKHPGALSPHRFGWTPRALVRSDSENSIVSMSGLMNCLPSKNDDTHLYSRCIQGVLGVFGALVLQGTPGDGA